MKSLVVVVIVFFLFLIEGGMMPWLLPNLQSAQISPHLALTIIILYGLYVHRHAALALGLVFGFLHDLLYYSYMLGMFTFAMGLTGYTAGLIPKKSNPGYVSAMLLTSGCLLFFESIIETLYMLFRIAREPVAWTLLHKVLPSVAFNSLFALIIYVPFRFIIDKIILQQTDEETS